jgi:hypothetical protein
MKRRAQTKGADAVADGWFVVNVRDAEWWTSEQGEKQPTGSEPTR